MNALGDDVIDAICDELEVTHGYSPVGADDQSASAVPVNGETRRLSGLVKGRHPIENAFCRLKDFRRIATRYDKLAANFLSGVALATALACWL